MVTSTLFWDFQENALKSVVLWHFEKKIIGKHWLFVWKYFLASLSIVQNLNVVGKTVIEMKLFSKTNKMARGKQNVLRRHVQLYFFSFCGAIA